MSKTGVESVADRLCPNLIRVFRYVQTSVAELPETIDLDCAAREFNHLLDVKHTGASGHPQSQEKNLTPAYPRTPVATEPLKWEPNFTPRPAQEIDLSSLSVSSDSVPTDGVPMATVVASSATTQKAKSVPALEAEIATLKETITYQEVKIAELTERLSEMASVQMSQSNPDVTDLSDNNRPTKLGERFGELYDNEWSDAFEDLKDQMDEKDVLYTLLRIVRHGSEFCQLFAEDQMKRLIGQLDEFLQRPKFCDRDSHKEYQCTLTMPPDVRQQHYLRSMKMAKEFRKQCAKNMIPVVKMLFNGLKIPQLFRQTSKELLPSVQAYVDACIEVIWLMTVQDPPMAMRNAAGKAAIDSNLFKCYSKSGKTVEEPVWPAVLLHEGGPLISKGYVLPK